MILLIFLSSVACFAADKFQNFAELSQANKAGVDYRISVRRKPSARCAALAIHGGAIEPGTSEVASAIAGEEHSLYLFEGLRDADAFDLHITSTRFDEPRALDFVKAVDLCVSIHGFKDTLRDVACVGGGNAELARATASALKSAGLGIEVEHPCTGLAGTHPKNIVNRCNKRGVQLELSRKLRDGLLSSPERMKVFTSTVRSVVTSHLNNH